MTASDMAAWWGAGIASLVAIWNIVVWWTTRPKLRIAHSTNMIIFDANTPEIPEADRRKYFTCTVTSNRNTDTKIRSVSMVYFVNRIARLLRLKPESAMVAPNPVACDHYGNPITPNIPFILQPGHDWTAYMIQDESFEKMIRDGFLYVQIWHTMSRRPLIRRIGFPKTKDDQS